MHYKVHSVHETTVKVAVQHEGVTLHADAPARIVELVPEDHDPDHTLEDGRPVGAATVTHRQIYLGKEARDKALADFRDTGARFAIHIEKVTP